MHPAVHRIGAALALSALLLTGCDRPAGRVDPAPAVEAPEADDCEAEDFAEGDGMSDCFGLPDAPRITTRTATARPRVTTTRPTVRATTARPTTSPTRR